MSLFRVYPDIAFAASHITHVSITDVATKATITKKKGDETSIRQYSSPMATRRTYRFFVLLFGLWFALAPAVYAAPMTTMVAQAGISDDGGKGGCDGCPENDDARSLCQLMCMNTGQPAIALEPAKFISYFWDMAASTALSRTLKGSPPVPDPEPPKKISLL